MAQVNFVCHGSVSRDALELVSYLRNDISDLVRYELNLCILSMKCCAKVAGYYYHEKKEANHAGTENTEAKQKEGSHFRKKSFMQRRGDTKKKRKVFKQIK